METLFLFTTKWKLFLVATTISWLGLEFLPQPKLIFFLVGAMLVDLITGVLKSWKNGKVSKSGGFKNTAIKFSLYISCIVATWIAVNILSSIYSGIDYTILVTWVICFLSFIELYSVFENIYEIDPDSFLSKYIAKPFLSFFKGILKKGNDTLNNNDKDNDLPPTEETTNPS